MSRVAWYCQPQTFIICTAALLTKTLGNIRGFYFYITACLLSLRQQQVSEVQ